MKRYDGRTKPQPRDPAKAPPPPEEYMCLIRATYGKRKLSTHVAHKDLNKFQIAFSALLRSGMSNIGKKVSQPPPPTAAAQTAVVTAPPVTTTITASQATTTSVSTTSKSKSKSKSTKKAP